jgi:hypothetical protein
MRIRASVPESNARQLRPIFGTRLLSELGEEGAHLGWQRFAHELPVLVPQSCPEAVPLPRVEGRPLVAVAFGIACAKVIIFYHVLFLDVFRVLVWGDTSRSAAQLR